MGRAENSAEAYAVARARNAIVTLGLLCLALWPLLYGISKLESGADAAATRTLATRALVGGAVYLVLALGLHRVWTVAWVLVVLVYVPSLCLHLYAMTRYPSTSLAIMILVEFAVANRLLDSDARRAFLRVRRSRVPAEPELAEPAWTMPTVAAFPMAQPATDPPPPPAPKPAASFDYFA